VACIVIDEQAKFIGGGND